MTTSLVPRTPHQASSDPDFYIEKVGADFFLKKTHSYYAQVQRQLALTGLPWCDFCVYLSDSNEMCVDRIHFDSDYWENELLPKLKNFFFNSALSFIVGKAKRTQSCSRTNEELVLLGSHTWSSRKPSCLIALLSSTDTLFT